MFFICLCRETATVKFVKKIFGVIERRKYVSYLQSECIRFLIIVCLAIEKRWLDCMKYAPDTLQEIQTCYENIWALVTNHGMENNDDTDWNDSGFCFVF